MHEMRPFAPRTERIIGRSKEIGAITEALSDSSGRTHVLYFVGPGGICKTRLLEEAAGMTPLAKAPLHSSIIDLYHSEFHSVDRIQSGVVESLDPDSGHFQHYRDQRRRFRDQRAAGVAPDELKKARQEMELSFLADYNRLAAQKRLLLRFDTAELIQHESDPVQEVCQIEQEAVEIRNWFLETLPRLENTVTLLAGRPPAPLRAELEALQRDGRGFAFRAFDLKGLTLEENLQYFEALAPLNSRLKEVPQDMRRMTWVYTDGHPIRLSLVIDLILNGRDIADLFPQSEDAAQVEKTQVDKRLITELMDLSPPIREMLHYLVLARKGLDAELLQYLEPEWGERQCHDNLAQMQRFTFVKPRHTENGHPDRTLLFLHDELYELFDRYVLRERRDEYVPTYKKLAAYCGEKLPQARSLEEERTLRTNQLYYELYVDPWQAFWGCYIPWDEAAVRAFDANLDMRLRDELLRFLKETQEDPWVYRRLSRDVVGRDAAVRWIRRYLSRGEHQQAAEIGRRVLQSDQELFRSDDPLYRSALQTAHAETLIYTGADESQPIALLDHAIGVLEGWRPTKKDDPRDWWRMRILGRAYNNKGYIHRLAGRNGAAIREYERAIWYFRRADIQDEMADTLTNMGFVYARWGDITKAQALLEDAIELREHLGQAFAQALSINTLGLAYAYSNAPAQAERRCREALATFEQLNQPRGIGLSCNAMGLASRKHAEQWKQGTYSPQEAEEFFAQAEGYLQTAERIFTTDVSEPIRLWETYNELGSTYCDWAWLLLQQGKTKDAQEKYDLAVEQLQKSIEVAEKHDFHLQAADSYDDMAQVYADRGRPEPEVEKWLDKVRQKIPQEYILTEQGFRDIPDPVEDWWLALGKLHLGYWVRAIKKAVEQEALPEEKDRLLEEAVDHYARAVAYFQQYSPDAYELHTTSKSIYRRLKTVRADRLERVRRQITDFARGHKINLDRLLLLLDATLGLEPSSG